MRFIGLTSAVWLVNNISKIKPRVDLADCAVGTVRARHSTEFAQLFSPLSTIATNLALILVDYRARVLGLRNITENCMGAIDGSRLLTQFTGWPRALEPGGMNALLPCLARLFFGTDFSARKSNVV